MDIGRTLPADLSAELGELLSHKALYEALAKVVGDPVAELAEDRTIARWNLAAEALTGYSAQNLIGKPLREILAAGIDEERLLDVPHDGQPHEVHFAIRDAGGHSISVRGYALALRAGERVDGWLLSILPARALDEIEQLKSEFVGTVSHELKTPLAAIKAYCETMLANAALSKEQTQEYLGVISFQADRLERLIDNLLLVTRVEAGQLLKRRVKLGLDAILERAIAELSYDASAYSIELSIGDAKVSGDPDRLVSVFTHLLDNAIKYMPGGGVVRIEAEEADGKTLVSVHDQGIGIEDEHLPFIFDRFYRVDSDLTSSVGGSGLGLFLVHALVRAHGGVVEVRSDPGVGSVFTLSLPVRD